MNVVIVTGRLTTDPVVHTGTTEDGTTWQIAILPVAVPQPNGRDGAPCFIDVIVRGARAEAAATWLAKGHKVGVRGRLSLDEWHAPDGTRRRSHRILADEVEFLSRTPEPNGDHDTAPAETAA
jgi:single-strand DNA-binding protein